MSERNARFPSRKSIRLRGFDYSQDGWYFITICCQNRKCWFGHVENGHMILNPYGQIAFNSWVETPIIRPHVELGEFIIMPNHIHGIIRLNRRGESHSPVLGLESDWGESHSPVLGLESDWGESHSPVLGLESDWGESHSPVLGLESDWGESHSPVLGLESDWGESHSPVLGLESDWGESHSPVLGLESDSPTICLNTGECDSPPRSPSQTIGAIVRGYKSSVTKQLVLLGFENKLWQRNYFERIITDENMHQRVSKYIIDNPLKWSADRFYHP
jgi:putative transposase